ncbi:MAG: hypothetical protein ACRDQV_18360, partial [Pseudonocardiaceae bacterium]
WEESTALSTAHSSEIAIMIPIGAPGTAPLSAAAGRIECRMTRVAVVGSELAGLAGCGEIRD